MPAKPVPPAVREAALQYLRELAKRTGKQGGKARWKGTTPDERSRAMRAVRAQALTKGSKKPGQKKS